MAAELPQSLKESLDHSKCEYRRLGNTGLKVSVPILGAMSLGTPEWQPWVANEEDSLPLLKAAYDRGLNTVWPCRSLVAVWRRKKEKADNGPIQWDTANVYSGGYSEIVIGKAVKKYDIPRHKVVILTKCYSPVGEEP